MRRNSYKRSGGRYLDALKRDGHAVVSQEFSSGGVASTSAHMCVFL